MFCIMNEQVFSLPSRIYCSTVTSIYPHAACALFRPAQNWQDEEYYFCSYFVLINDEVSKIIVFVFDAVKPFIPQKKDYLANIY